METFEDIPRAHFRAVMADPPWSFRTWSKKNISKTPDAHYACMSWEEISAMPVGDLAHPEGCSLTLWATAPMLDRAFALMEAWGFRFKTTGAWAKQSSTGAKWAFGTGYVLRSAAEFYLIGTRGNPKPRSRSVRNLIVSPVREHSRKPDRMREDVEALWEGPYLELFARSRAPGWTAFGNEVDRFKAA